METNKVVRTKSIEHRRSAFYPNAPEDALNRMEGLDDNYKKAFAEFEAKIKRQIRAGEADDGETDPNSYGSIQFMDFIRQVPDFPRAVIDTLGRAPDDFWMTAPVYMWYCTRYAYKQALISENLTDLDPELQSIDKEALRVLRRLNTSYSTISEATNYVRYTLLSGLENKAKDRGVDSLFSVARLQFQSLQRTAGRMTERPADQTMTWGSGSGSQADDEPVYSVIVPSVSPVPEPSMAQSLVPSDDEGEVY
ncbi:hypothetical protein Poli38472_010873 [Pythium oligandrum]|uniref:Uncharacterized protein n=1 Tax=Pythium oligandrum TaxID=41045 RepID=A0A8K1CEN7_PYTOL|nr:hypothetical protein Poli38472_010873 [Pythium oligandrum]|eukprot:TMW61810.1 hypothetical protein Poli38472_010873 [Pythium oligandrum]